MSSTLPTTHQALVIESKELGLQLETVPTPGATPGSLILQVLAASILSYHKEIYNGKRPYPLATPLVGGVSAIGRVAATGPDATLLKAGQLVFFDCTIRGRDDPSAMYLVGIHEGFSDGSRKLAREVWHDGAFAEYIRVPLENCLALNETKLCQELSYSIPDLMYLSNLLVAYGGLRDIRIEAGDTVVVCPATGAFGGAGVLVAAAMGAKVIAMGRNETELERLKKYMRRGLPWSAIETVKITGDQSADTAALEVHGPVDAILDLTPPFASGSTHLKSAVAALRYEGRVSLMGFNDMPLSEAKLIADNITLKGKLMYSREDMKQSVKILERGMLPKGGDLVDTKIYSLADHKSALDAAAEWTGLGKQVVFVP
ncbi:Alcohol dehydrogenase 1 [Pseudocercospora fuligena]|uniref:Alcohol dehydrogenase 1 n=1 Tax=Pseudocercospora fuligena TaxID=685502 RepID=A0A8H6VIC0_9PEZI|nr:Alcohol dehydrogenase 1 [Pseudocercospora fuligena]